MTGSASAAGGGAASPGAAELMPERFAAQLLAGPRALTAEAVVDRLLAVQAQDSRGARLAIRARSTGVTAADVDRALAERALVVSWLNRGTLHLVRAQDYGWLHALTTPPVFPANARRLAQEGVPPRAAERGVAAIERALENRGPQTRPQLREVVAAAGVRTEGQALVHLLLLASLRGLIVRGPVVGKDHAFVLVRDWLGAPPAMERDTSLAQLARRYLAGHGPASERDLARWSGLPLRDARRALSAIAPELVQRPDATVALRGSRTGGALPPPRLLGPYEPVLLGWTSRQAILGRYTSIVTTNGLFRAFALVDGRAAGTWTLGGGRLELSPFAPLSQPVAEALELETRDVVRFLGS